MKDRLWIYANHVLTMS